MLDLVQLLLTNADWNAKSRALLDYVNTSHPAFVAVAVIVLIVVGSKVVSASPGVRRGGLRLGLVTFLLFLGYEWYRAETFGKGDLPAAALTAFNAGGFVLAATWIVLPVVAFVYEHLRLALAAFLGYSVYALVTAENFSSEQLPDIGLRALVAVALTLVVAWIVHPIWDYIAALLPRPKRRPDREDAADDEAERRRGRHRRHPRAEGPAEEPVAVAPPAEVAPAPPAALPVPAEVVTAELEVVAALPADDQRRRDRIRLQVEMAYVMATPHLGGRLPRQTFNELLDRYLGDHQPLEAVEDNSRQLLLFLQEHQQQAATPPTPAPAPPTLTNVAVLASAPVQPAAALPSVAAAALEELLRRLIEEQHRTAAPAAELRFQDTPASDTPTGTNHLTTADTVPNGNPNS